MTDTYTTKLSTANCAVVLVDFLDGFLPGLRSIDRDLYERNIDGFCATAHALDLPHCVLGDERGFRGQFFPVIKSGFAEAPTFDRHTPSAMRSGDFADWARARLGSRSARRRARPDRTGRHLGRQLHDADLARPSGRWFPRLRRGRLQR